MGEKKKKKKKKKSGIRHLWFSLKVIDSETEQAVVKIDKMVEEKFMKAIEEIKRKFR